MPPLLFSYYSPEAGLFSSFNFFIFINFPLSNIFFQFHLSFPRFDASDKRDGLTSWARETCCLPPDPPKSLLPYWTVICPNSMLFPPNKEAESMWGKRVRSPVKATSLLRQLSSKKTASKERERERKKEKVSESSKLLHEKQFKWMQFIIMFCSCIQFYPLNLCQSLSQGSLLELCDVECFCCSSNTQW